MQLPPRQLVGFTWLIVSHSLALFVDLTLREMGDTLNAFAHKILSTISKKLDSALRVS